jgi:hypothetical protein
MVSNNQARVSDFISLCIDILILLMPLFLLLALLLQVALQCNFTHYTFPEWKAFFGIAFPNATVDALREAIFNVKVVELENYPFEGCGLTKFAADTPQEVSGNSCPMQRAPTSSFLLEFSN